MDSKIWILGPCSMESRELFFQCLEHISSFMSGDDLWYMKSSFDKANRTKINSKRGPGIDAALDIWREAKELFPDIKFTTDVHECSQVAKLRDVIDVIQIPAFLSRQTDLIVECAKNFDVVNVKKGQWMGPDSARHISDKIKTTSPDCQSWICDRGSNFGYDELFVNFNITEKLKESFDAVILDCTHSTQRTKSVHGSQGDWVLASRYFLTASVFGYNGVFAETHPSPSKALSDRDNMIPLKEMKRLVEKSKIISEYTK